MRARTPLVAAYALAVATMTAAGWAALLWMMPGVRLASCLPLFPDDTGLARTSMVFSVVAAATWFGARIVAERTARAAPVQFGHWMLTIMAIVMVFPVIFLAAPISPAQIEGRAECGYTQVTSLLISATLYLPLLGVLFADLAARLKNRAVWVRASIAMASCGSLWLLTAATLRPFG